ncbi:MAG: peptidoglycan-N-acetylglucosamine deacetylase [Solirubrobacteraceae bacterium]|nr:peptidoglycan-N-acetylglucosamine deacetylase [Solirubrobacteraceae bacterium]
MEEPADRLRARRAARTAELRRRRRRRAGAAGLLAPAAVVAVVVLLGTPGGRARPAESRPAPPAPVGAASPGGAPHPTPATQRAALARLAAIGRPVYCGAPTRPLVALTFDDGPGPYTKLAIRKLRRRHLRATFFLVGKSINSFPSLARLEQPVGAVGDHTMTHPFLPGLSPAAMAQEIADARTVIERSSGQPVGVFRPPYGARTPAIDAEAKALGLVEVIWTVDSADSLGADYAGISRNAIAGLRPGSIILMHENRGQTIRALATILPAIAAKHLRAVTLPELLTADPPSLAQLRAGGRGCGVSR